MGGFLARLFRKRPQMRVLLLGLDAAGKTTILKKMAGKPTETVPTVGFNVETIRVENLELVVWDVAGQDRLRPFWRHYYRGTSGVVFVVDSNDAERFPLARKELHGIMQEEELQLACVLVFANKMDLPNACSAAKVADELQLDVLEKAGRETHVVATVALEGKGFDEGFHWLAETMKPI